MLLGMAKKRGRPRMSASERKGALLFARVNRETRSLVDKAASAAGLKTSDWVRSRIHQAAEREVKGSRRSR
jgi:uncharacterized protein (DUF1778 family)